MVDSKAVSLSYAELVEMGHSRSEEILSFSSRSLKELAEHFGVTRAAAHLLHRVAGGMRTIYPSRWGAEAFSESDVIELMSEIDPEYDGYPSPIRHIPPDRPEGTWSPWIVAGYLDSPKCKWTSIKVPILLADIFDVPFPSRVITALRRFQIHFIAELVTLGPRELPGLPGIGRTSVEQMQLALDIYDCQLGTDLPAWEERVSRNRPSRWGFRGSNRS